MTTGRLQPSDAPRPASLALLGRRVREAREAVMQHRHVLGGSTDLADARSELLQALEDYTSALERAHLPVPPALRDELALHRRLFR